MVGGEKKKPTKNKKRIVHAAGVGAVVPKRKNKSARLKRAASRPAAYKAFKQQAVRMSSAGAEAKSSTVSWDCQLIDSEECRGFCFLFFFPTDPGLRTRWHWLQRGQGGIWSIKHFKSLQSLCSTLCGQLDLQTNKQAWIPGKHGCGHICRIIFRHGFLCRESSHVFASMASLRIEFPNRLTPFLAEASPSYP